MFDRFIEAIEALADSGYQLAQAINDLIVVVEERDAEEED